MYDNNADIFGFIYNGTEYFYVKNAQNDVVAITDSTGKVIANYYYDDWGKLIETTGNTEIANLNPIRYRSYYYDGETGWYYLNTRYYAPEMSRFLNADGYVQTGQGMLDKNMFVYCLNNPVNNLDSNGELCIAAIVVGVGALAFGMAFLFSSDGHRTVEHENASNENNIIFSAEHRKKGTTNPANRAKHEKGQARKQRDQIGEKGDARRKPNPNKRRPSNFISPEIKQRLIYSAAFVATSAVCIYIIANDTTVVGAVDDALLGVLGPIVWENFRKVIA